MRRSAQNTLLVDGRGQEVEWSPIAWREDLSPSAAVDYVVSRVEQGYGPKVKRFDRHVYFIEKRFFVVVDDVELASGGLITWNFHGVKGATLTAGEVGVIVNGGAELRIVGMGAGMRCGVEGGSCFAAVGMGDGGGGDGGRVAWVMAPGRAGAQGVMPTVEVGEGFCCCEGGEVGVAVGGGEAAGAFGEFDDGRNVDYEK